MGVCGSKEKNKNQIVKVEAKPKPILSHSGCITRLKLLSNGKILSNSTADKRIIMYDFSSGNLKAINGFTGHDAISTPLVEFNDTLLSGDYSGNLLIWSLKDFELKDKVETNNSAIAELSQLTDGRLLAFYSNDTFKILDPSKNFAASLELKSSSKYAKIALQNPINGLLAIYKGEDDINFIDLVQDTIVHKITQKYIMHFFFKKNGNTIVIGLSKVFEYDKDSFKLIKTIEVPLSGGFGFVWELQNGNFIASNPHGQCIVFDSEFKLLTTIDANQKSEESYYCRVLQLNDGSILISDYFGVIRVFGQDYKLLSKVEALKK